MIQFNDKIRQFTLYSIYIAHNAQINYISQYTFYQSKHQEVIQEITMLALKYIHKHTCEKRR